MYQQLPRVWTSKWTGLLEIRDYEFKVKLVSMVMFPTPPPAMYVEMYRYKEGIEHYIQDYDYHDDYRI